MGSGPSSHSEVEILLVEDNPGDVRLIEEVFRDGKINNPLHTVTDGEEALDFIHHEGEYEDAPRPDLVLLDLNLPKVDGEDVLHEIKHHPGLEGIPVIILAGVDSEYIKSQDLDHDAEKDAVIEKPVEPGELVDLICELDSFQLAVIRTDEK